MNTTHRTAIELVRAVMAGCSQMRSLATEVVVFPPFPYLRPVAEASAGSPISSGGQDLSPQPSGAFTGQTSAEMLLDCGAKWTIIGHSERRHGLGESDQLCGAKLARALEAGLSVVFCVGETWEEREAGQAHEVNRRQLEVGFASIKVECLDRVVVAYEPVWAIGTGRTASAQDAQTSHRLIREWIANRYDPRSSAGVRILYGGSVTAANASTLFAEEDIDGGLIGGASLKVADFLAIIAATQANADIH